MTTKEYAKALYAISKESPSATLGKDFVAYLSAKGKLAILPSILRVVEKMEAKELRDKTCTLIVADEKSLHSATVHAKEFIAELGGDPKQWTIEERIDPSLIGGYIIRTPERELDMSDKHGLYRLYEKLRSAS
jgi:F0F1-type ATP synthase delta subunit